MSGAAPSGVAAAVAAAGGGTAAESFGQVIVDVPRAGWASALAAGAAAGATYLDFLTAYDELDDGFAVVAHVSTLDAREHVLVRTRVPRDEPVLETATGVYAGAAWHERETHEMFGIDFAGNDDLEPLLLPEGFGAHPLRKDFVLAARVSVPWPGDKDPADSTGKARRRTLPPGVPPDWPTGVVGEGPSGISGGQSTGVVIKLLLTQAGRVDLEDVFSLLREALVCCPSKVLCS